MSVTIEGFERVERFLNLFPSEIKQSADNICGVAASMVQVEAQRNVPVRTGRLQRSIQVIQLAFMKWKVGSDLYYAGFVEFGTSRMQAHPYMRPAWASVEPRVKAALYRLVAQLLNRF